MAPLSLTWGPLARAIRGHLRHREARLTPTPHHMDSLATLLMGLPTDPGQVHLPGDTQAIRGAQGDTLLNHGMDQTWALKVALPVAPLGHQDRDLPNPTAPLDQDTPEDHTLPVRRCPATLPVIMAPHTMALGEGWGLPLPPHPDTHHTTRPPQALPATPPPPRPPQ